MNHLHKFFSAAFVAGSALCFSLLTTGCKSSASTTAVYAPRAVECLGVEHDGSQTLRVYGTGRNKADAVEQAKKNAVRKVIFKGITHGQQGCQMRPILAEVNAEERYEEYFNIFFADGGEYLKYVSLVDERAHSRDKMKAQAFVGYTITVRVLRPELKARLKADNVLK